MIKFEEVATSKIFYALETQNEFFAEAATIEVQQILEEFEDIMSIDLPPGLPLMRDIQNQIDLVLGSSLPNKFHYRMISKEHEELSKQVKELLEIGYIKKNMSLCAIPALLVPKKDGPLNMRIDSKVIKKVTINCCSPIPRLDDMLDYLRGAKIFSKILFEEWVSLNLDPRRR